MITVANLQPCRLLGKKECNLFVFNTFNFPTSLIGIHTMTVHCNAQSQASKRQAKAKASKQQEEDRKKELDDRRRQAYHNGTVPYKQDERRRSKKREATRDQNKHTTSHCSLLFLDLTHSLIITALSDYENIQRKNS